MTDTMVEISICIANYNGRDIIDRCIQSVLTQDCSCHFEVIVHDDASTDNSIEIIKKYKEVTLIKSETNVGYCESNNRMASTAKGQYLLFLNNDAALGPNAIKSLVQEAKLHDRAILTLQQRSFEDHTLIDQGMMLDIFANPRPNTDPNRRDVAMVMGACLWIPRSLWDNLGGFPHWFHTLAEDMYLCCYARLLDYPVKAVDKSYYLHEVGYSLGGGKVAANRLATTRKRRILSERNKTFILLLFWPAPRVWIIFPFHIVTLFIEGVILSIIKRDSSLAKDIYWNAIVSSFKALPGLLRKRRKIQEQKMAANKTFFSTISYFPHKLRLLFRHGVPSIK